jgi:hypothetical protein
LRVIDYEPQGSVRQTFGKMGSCHVQLCEGWQYCPCFILHSRQCSYLLSKKRDPAGVGASEEIWNLSVNVSLANSLNSTSVRFQIDMYIRFQIDVH